MPISDRGILDSGDNIALCRDLTRICRTDIDKHNGNDRQLPFLSNKYLPNNTCNSSYVHAVYSGLERYT